MGYEPIARWQQQLSGVLIAAIGGVGTVWIWHIPPWEGEYGKATIGMPAFLVLGLSIVTFPGYRDERIARGEDISGLSGLDLLTPRWWAILAVALAAGFGNYLLLKAR